MFIQLKTMVVILVILMMLSCKAQNPILPLDSLGWRNTDNAYYKDINNELNPFEGTWLYTNGNTLLKITLKKHTQLYNGKYYQDRIIGGYQYIEDGIEKVNTLEDVNNPNLNISASIVGNLIFKDCKFLPVDDCIVNEKRLGLSIDDPNSESHYGDLIIHKRTVNSQEALKINIEMNYSGQTTDGELPKPSIPWQMHNIVLLKQ